MSFADITALQAAIQAGKQANMPFKPVTTGTGTNAVAASGFISGLLLWNQIGTTLHSTLVPPVEPTGASNERLVGYNVIAARASGFEMVNLYKVGTLNLATTSGEFTHDAATFPILRTKMGQASQPINLTPLLYITTSTTVTPVQLTYDYVNQDGNSVTGTITFTLPAAATSAGALFRLPLEVGDSGVRDITDIKISVAASAGAANVYLAEIVENLGTPSTFGAGYRNSVVNSPNIPLVSPGVATSGTADMKSTIKVTGSGTTLTAYVKIQTVMDI